MTFFGVFRIFEACFVSPFLQHFFPAPWLRGKESVPQLPALPGHPDPPGRHQHPGHGNGGRVLTPRTRPYSEVQLSNSDWLSSAFCFSHRSRVATVPRRGILFGPFLSHGCTSFSQWVAFAPTVLHLSWPSSDAPPPLSGWTIIKVDRNFAKFPNFTQVLA